MVRNIPTSLGLLSLSVFASGCSDANKLASAYEKICEAECECPESDWNEVSTCKDYCRGYAVMLEASIEDRVETEPCATFDDVVKDLKDCAKQGCGETRDQCIQDASYALYQCWDLYDYDYYYQVGEPAMPELVQQLLKPIPGALESSQLHSATK